MNSKDYQRWALTKDRDYTDVIKRLAADHNLFRSLHAVLGLSGEVGELADAVKKTVMYNKPMDIENIKEEVGDVLWYMALLLDSVGSSFEEVMQMNHDKLEKRYPGGFTEKLAQERRDKNEPEEWIPQSRTRYFYKDDEYLSVNEAEMEGIWMNSYDKNWKFAASVARLSDFDGTCNDLLQDGWKERLVPEENKNA